MSIWERIRKGRTPLSTSPQWLIVGLGNPGAEYERTRHNLGFWVVDRLAEEADARLRSERRALAAPAVLADQAVLLVKPLTFVNLSGQAVAPLLSRLGLPAERLIVICDDLDLPEGKIRVRGGGGSGGHRGLASLTQHLGTDEFARIRVGIGRPPGRMDAADYVLKELRPKQADALRAACELAAQAVESLIARGLEATMAEYN